MRMKFGDLKVMLAAAMAIMLIAALACGAADEAAAPEAAKAAAAAATAVPAAAGAVVEVGKAKAAATAEPAAPAAPAAGSQLSFVRPTRVPAAPDRPPPMKAAEAGFKYVPEPQLPGVFWDYRYTGPRPTEFSENPKFAAMVAAGTLPSVEDRLPDEIKVVQPPHGIGVYGGIWRITATGGGPTNRLYWDKKNSDEVSEHLPHVGFFSISDDGRTYTYRRRKGLNWSDGTPMSMEDIRFAWEDANFNKTLHETPRGDWLDPVTGNIVKFAVIDDSTWSLTYDSPNFVLMEGEIRAGSNCGGSRYCFYIAAHHMKQFHEDYADAADIAKMIEEEEVGDWQRLWGLKSNAATNVEMPTMGSFILTSQSDTLSTWRTNPYFMEVDPEGSQLPYIDGAITIRVESREVAVFRTMAGETDAYGANYQIQEIPLYRSNMEKGNFSIKIWPITGPQDVGFAVCQTCNQDPELGKWLRTRDFRTAISHAMDRNSINETLYLGFGTPKNWSPHPSTPYYPGDAIAFQDTAYDVDKANALLDGLGLTAKDSDGYRLRSDGSGKRISFDSVSSLGWTTDVAVLLMDYLADVGIELKDKSMNSPWTLGYPGKVPLTIMRAFGLYGANPWFAGWSRCCPTGSGHVFAPDISDLPRSMKVGPNGAVPTEGGYTPRSGDVMSPIWEPKAPDYTYPADPTGNLLKLVELFHGGRSFSQYSPDRLSMGKEIFSIHALEKYYLGVVAHTGVFRSPLLNQNNFRNIPETHTADPVGWYGELYYFTGGVDNIAD